MKGGVLIIGSLLWDIENDRPNWRKKNLVEKDKIHVFAPIRYGKLSSDKVYTMVLSKSVEQNSQLGTAYDLPFKKEIQNKELFIQLKNLSKAEGKNDDKLVKGGDKKWCILGILFNPAFDQLKKEEILRQLAEKMKDDGISCWYQKICIPNEESILSVRGEMLINWLKTEDPSKQSILDSYDFVLATCTIPGLKSYPISQEMKENIILDMKRKYFFNNIANGITTFQDQEILDLLKTAVGDVSAAHPEP